MSSESRIWEIRPFGSMRGGGELVIGLVPFNPSSPAYSTHGSNASFQKIRFFGVWDWNFYSGSQAFRSAPARAGKLSYGRPFSCSRQRKFFGYLPNICLNICLDIEGSTREDAAEQQSPKRGRAFPL
jgi:hypothetical protein